VVKGNKLILGGKARQLLHLLKTWSLSAISLAISWLPNSLPEENLDRYLETLPFETSIEAQTHVNVARRTDGSVTISLRNFVAEWIKRTYSLVN
jgi:hypothetical protein